MPEIVRHSLWAYGMKVAGALLAFIFNVAIARILGASGAGIYFLSLSIVIIASVISRIGLDVTLLRFVSLHDVKNEQEKLRFVVAFGIGIVFLISSIFTLFGLIFADKLALFVFNKPELIEPLKWMSLSIVPFSILNLYAESLKGKKEIKFAMVVQGVGVPLVGLILIFPLSAISGALGVIWSYVLATSIIAVSSWFIWNKVNIEPLKKIDYPLKNIYNSCKHLFIVSLVNRGIQPWGPLFLVGIWYSSDSAGIFGAATRVAMLVSFTLVAVNNVLVPKFTELYAKDEILKLARLARKAALFVTLLSSPLFLVLIFKGGLVMSLFGEDFRRGGTLLAILAVGQFVNAFTGSVNHLLIVTGYERIVRNISMFGTFLLIGGCVIAIPPFGIIGAGIVVAGVRCFTNFSAVYQVNKLLGINTIPFMRDVHVSTKL